MAIVKQIPAETFNELAKGAGMITTTFTPSTPATLERKDILCATSGGVHITCVPTVKDNADGIDNAVLNMLEFQEITDYTVEMSFTCKTVNITMLGIAMGLSTESSGKLTPKHGMLTTADVKDIWLVVPQTDKKCFAACVKNAFSTGGLDLQTENDGTGSLTVTLKGMYSIKAQDTVPLECYIIEEGTPG